VEFAVCFHHPSLSSISFNNESLSIHFSTRTTTGHHDDCSFGAYNLLMVQHFQPSAAASAPLFARRFTDDCSFGANNFWCYSTSLRPLLLLSLVIGESLCWFWPTISSRKLIVCTADESCSNEQAGILYNPQTGPTQRKEYKYNNQSVIIEPMDNNPSVSPFSSAVKP